MTACQSCPRRVRRAGPALRDHGCAPVCPAYRRYARSPGSGRAGRPDEMSDGGAGRVAAVLSHGSTQLRRTPYQRSPTEPLQECATVGMHARAKTAVLGRSAPRLRSRPYHAVPTTGLPCPAGRRRAASRAALAGRRPRFRQRSQLRVSHPGSRCASGLASDGASGECIPLAGGAAARRAHARFARRPCGWAGPAVGPTQPHRSVAGACVHPLAMTGTAMSLPCLPFLASRPRSGSVASAG